MMRSTTSWIYKEGRRLGGQWKVNQIVAKAIAMEDLATVRRDLRWLAMALFSFRSLASIEDCNLIRTYTRPMGL
jgi:hypothetical protein